MTSRLMLILFLLFSPLVYSGAVDPIVREPDLDGSTGEGEPDECEGEGNPIARRLGNKFQQEVEYTATNLNSLSFSRFYNSRLKRSGDLWRRTKGSQVGYVFAEAGQPLPEASGSTDTFIKKVNVFTGKWSHTYSTRLEILRTERNGAIEPKMRLTLYRDDGYEKVWPFITDDPSNESYKYSFGEFGFLKYVNDHWEVRAQDNRKIYRFDDEGRLLEIEFVEGQKHTLTYENHADHRIVTVVDDYDNSLVFKEDNLGNLIYVDLPNGKKISYVWENNLLTKAEYPGAEGGTVNREYHYLPYSFSQTPHFEGFGVKSVSDTFFGWAHYTALTGITDEEGKRYVSWGYNFRDPNAVIGLMMARAVSSENTGGFNKVEINSEDANSSYNRVKVTKGKLERLYVYNASPTGTPYLRSQSGDEEKAGCELSGNKTARFIHTWLNSTSHPPGYTSLSQRTVQPYKYIIDDESGLVDQYGYYEHNFVYPNSNPYVTLPVQNKDIEFKAQRIPKGSSFWGEEEPQFCHPDEQYGCLYRKETYFHNTWGDLLSANNEGHMRGVTLTSSYAFPKNISSSYSRDLDSAWNNDTEAHYKSYGTKQTWGFTYTTDSDPIPNLIKQIDGPRTDVTDTITYDYYPAEGSYKGFVRTITDPKGLVTTFEEYTPDGRPLKIKLPTGLVLTLTYHPRGWLTSIDEGGALTQYSYYENGLLKRITDPEGNWIEYTYNAGRILTKIAANNGDEVNFTAFDHYGQWEELNIKDGPDGTIRYQQNRAFDAVGRLEELTGQNGQNLTSPFDGQDNIKYFRQKYEQQDGTIATRDTNLERDILGRIRKVTYPDGGVILLDYDKRDNLTKVTDQNNLVTTYTYDGFDNLARVDSPDTGTTKYWYDLAGNVTKVEDQNGITVTYQYDANNRLQYVTYPASSEENITFIYDETSDGKQGIGELTTITFEHGTIEYFYNSRSEIIKELRTVEGELYETLYDRNLNGEITKITYPSGREVQYHYTDGLITKVSTRENDTASWLVVAENLSYKPFGPLKGLDLGNGLTLTKDYDLDYRITENILKQSDTESLKDKAYSYYITDNISAILENTGNIDSQLFAYDAVDRLTSATGEYGNYAYGYDGVGNRTSINRNSTAHSYEYYSGTHRLKQIKQGETVIRSFQYDAAGNLIEDNRGSDVFKLAYNSEGRPKQLERYQNGTLTNSTLYKYNPLGQRIMMVTDGANHYLNYGLDGRMMAEYTDNNTLKAEYIYLHGDLLAVVQPEQVAWAGVNESGGQLSPIAESNNTLTIAASTGTRFYSHTLEGDGEIQTKVGNIGHAKDLSKAGLMIKESQAADAPYVKLVRTSESSFVPIAGEIFIPLIFGKDGMMLEYTDSSTNQVVQKTFSDQGDWLKLVRTGNYIEAQVSTDGVTWTTVESVFQPMKSNVQLGVITQNIQATDELVLEQVQTQGTLYTAQASAIYYAYNNHLGAPLLLTDQAGNTVWEVTYSPFGETTTQVDSIDQPIRLPGQYAYDATGYYYNYFRDYDPSLGRYVQSDPIGLSGGISTYGYVGGNPLMYIDPEGLDLKKKVRDVIFVLGLGLSDGDVSPDAGRRTHDHRDNKGRTEQLQFEKRKKRPFDPDKKDKDKGNGDLPSFSPWDFPVWNACQAGEAPCSVCEAFGYSSPSCNDVPEEC